MTIIQPSTRGKRPRRRHNYWFEKLMAAIALLNYLLVLFDLSYIPLRDEYLRNFPEFTRWYGEQFKGIEPNRTTEAYLDTVDQLKQALQREGLPDADAVEEAELSEQAEFLDADAETIEAINPGVPVLLQELRTLSDEVIDENPFEIANKTGTLERIKARMRDRLDEESSKQAFTEFWSVAYLEDAGWIEELEFFDEEIRPLFETNYFRSIGLDGQPTDLFWRIDIWFVGIFAAELLLRSFYLSRRYQGTSMLDALLWRWYDLLLLLPFWRWLRIIPVIVRINQSNLIDLEPISNRIRRAFVTHFAIELTEIVIIRVIDQAQNLVRNGEIARVLLNPGQGGQYIDLNDVNEVEAIASQLVKIMVYKVLPQVRPDVEALLDHTLTRSLHGAPMYNNFQVLPGFESLSHQLAQQVSHSLYENIYGVLTSSIKDEKGAELTEKLINHTGEVLRQEIRQGDTVSEFESLMIVMLEEIKINYVQSLAEEDVEMLREQTNRLYQVTQGGK
jgi:hypothetical protein